MVFHSNILHCTFSLSSMKMMKIRVLVIIITIASIFFQLLHHSQTFLLPTKTWILVLTEDQAENSDWIAQINLTLQNTPTKLFLSVTNWRQRANGRRKQSKKIILTISQIRSELKPKSSYYANDQFENLINPYKEKFAFRRRKVFNHKTRKLY